MFKIEIEHTGGLHSEAVHAQSGTRLITDAPVDNHGRGESFSPTDLVATALGTCMLTIMGILADRDGIDLSGTTVKVGKEMVTSPERRIGRLSVDIHVPAALGEEDQKRLK